jgi:hypothetical protein
MGGYSCASFELTDWMSSSERARAYFCCLSSGVAVPFGESLSVMFFVRTTRPSIASFSRNLRTPRETAPGLLSPKSFSHHSLGSSGWLTFLHLPSLVAADVLTSSSRVARR